MESAELIDEVVDKAKDAYAFAKETGLDKETKILNLLNELKTDFN